MHALNRYVSSSDTCYNQTGIYLYRLKGNTRPTKMLDGWWGVYVGLAALALAFGLGVWFLINKRNTATVGISFTVQQGQNGPTDVVNSAANLVYIGPPGLTKDLVLSVKANTNNTTGKEFWVSNQSTDHKIGIDASALPAPGGVLSGANITIDNGQGSRDLSPNLVIEPSKSGHFIFTAENTIFRLE